MFLVTKTRNELIKCLPKNGVVAEIGVDKGDFSRVILENNNPNILYLIDPWKAFDPYSESYINSEVEDLPEDITRFNFILDKFKNDIEQKKVVALRYSSNNAVQFFPDEFFDWIYLDGNHTYKKVLDDLNLYSKKIKKDGFIICHDYVNYEAALYYKIGVVDAVNDFCKKSDFNISLITLSEQDNSNCVLVKDYNENVDTFLYNVVKNIGNIIEFDNMSKLNFKQKEFLFQDGDISTRFSRFVHTFGVKNDKF